MKTLSTLILVGVCALWLVPGSGPRAQGAARQVWVTTTESRSFEGTLSTDSLTLTVNGSARKIPLRDVLSFHSAEPASPLEAGMITSCLAAMQGKDAKVADAAAAELVEIGLPAMNPLLAAYKDTDGHEPDPLYRVFGRIIPGYADALDRKLDLVRLADGTALRGKLVAESLSLKGAKGETITLAPGSIRRLAVRQPTISRTFDLQALRHCTYVGWFDTGVSLSDSSRVQADSAGYVRLDFNEDGWSADPDGIVTPLPGKRKLQEGYRWGVVLGRVGSVGDRWLAGKHFDKSGLGAGRLFFVINDNEHWQNNIGSYRMRLKVSDAYDVGEPQ